MADKPNDTTKISCPHCKREITLSDAGKILGKIGGSVTKTRYGKEHFSELGKRGMASRWKK
jgi:hypothetical protein